ncbi:MAG: cell division protein FtsQ, partial [Mesorhizobium sp.]
SGGKQSLLPLIVGTGAPAKAPDFLARIKKYPELAARVKGYIRIGERRWDLKLENGITVKLPEDGEDRAIADLVRMDRENGL